MARLLIQQFEIVGCKGCPYYSQAEWGFGGHGTTLCTLEHLQIRYPKDFKDNPNIDVDGFPEFCPLPKVKKDG
jgi:hypothetical protein